MKNARDFLVMAMQSVWLLVLLSVSCAADYRTDEEKANGVVLEQWVIDNRAYGRREQLRRLEADDREKHFRDALNRCGFQGQLIGDCL